MPKQFGWPEDKWGSMFNITGEALKWLFDHLRPRWFWSLVVFAGIGLSLWNSIPDKFKTIILDYAIEKTSGKREAIDIEIAEFSVDGPDREFLTWVRNKVERNLVELFVDHGKRTAHRLAALKPSSMAEKRLVGDISALDDQTVEISIRLVDQAGATTASTQLAASKEFIKEHYKVLPETLVYGLDVGYQKLEPLDTKARPTKSLKAYALYLHSRYSAGRGDYEKALALLDQALLEDRSFATAHWAAAQILREMGDEAGGKQRADLADEINPDHFKGAFLDGVSKPLPDLMKASSSTNWVETDQDFYFKQVRLPAYGVEFSAWKFDPKKYALKVVMQESDQGSTVSELRKKKGAILGVNGGFFEIDRESRLSPSGFVVSGGRRFGEYRKGAGSGLLYEKFGTTSIGWSREWEDIGDVTDAVQAGPMIVDPGGKNGIVKNNFNRHNRTAICVTTDGLVGVFVVDGGLSLFELGAILSSSEADGGFNCERAINLDGGPSSQAAFKSSTGKYALDIPGTWTAQNAVLVTLRKGN